jgi:3-deoxy-D-manno-octulosonic acid kinase
MTEPQIIKDGRSWILYDADLLALPSEIFFDVEFLAQKGRLDQPDGGRGTCYFFRHNANDWVLRHYSRGGMIRRLLSDQYLGLAHSRSRSWREWHLLHRLYFEGLPVPRPVAARTSFNGCVYRADLITEQIPEVSTLAERISVQELTRENWYAVGACIRLFHNRGVWHADLNAHNVLLDKLGKVYLLDFDRGEFRGGQCWKKGTLQRLKRSLLKVCAQSASGAFPEQGWKTLMDGYTNCVNGAVK